MALNTGQIIGVAKKNLFSIICALIAVAAVVATFWPIGGMVAALQTTADGRAAMYGQLDSLLNQPRKLPLTDPSKTTQDDLAQFPNQKTIDLGNEVTANVSKQSTDMVKLLVSLNSKSHAPLVDNVLPIAVSATPKFHFGEVYSLVLAPLSPPPNSGATAPAPRVSIATNAILKAANQRNLCVDVLEGGTPPTEIDIKAAQDDLWNNEYLPHVITINGQQKNLEKIKADYAKESVRLPDRMRTDVATQRKIYVAADAFQINDTVTGQREPLPQDIWFSQLTLWIQQDVAQAIAETNASAKNILEAPVKNLIKVSIPLMPSPYVGITLVAPGQPPAAPPTPTDGGDISQIKPDYTVGPTGRSSNQMYDVVHFTVTVEMDASQIPALIENVGQNRLIDVYNFNQTSVDSVDQRNNGFIYGSKPMVRITLYCEALFLRQWTLPLMPVEVKKLINIAIAPAGTPTAAPVAQ